MLSATSDHAVRAILVLGRAYGQRPVRADEIAEAIGAPRNYLAKTLNALAKAGLVESARGPQGGFTLAIRPDELTLARVVDCFDEPRPQTKCLLGNAPCDRLRPYTAYARWTEITHARRAPLDTTTIASLLGDRAPGSTPFTLTAPLRVRADLSPAA